MQGKPSDMSRLLLRIMAFTGYASRSTLIRLDPAYQLCDHHMMSLPSAVTSQ